MTQLVCFRSYSSHVSEDAVAAMIGGDCGANRSVRSNEKRKHLSLKGRKCSLVTVTAVIDSECM